MNYCTRLLTTIAFLLVCTSSAQAKEVFTEAGQLIGTKYVVSYIQNATLSTSDSKGSKSLAAKSKSYKTVQAVEFFYLGDLDLLLIHEDGVIAVNETGLGAGEFVWRSENGHTYRLPASSFDSNSKYLIGTIHNTSDVAIGKFYVADRKATLDPAQGRYFGEMAFPGGKSLSFGLHVAGTTAWSNGCLPGNLPTHVEFAGYGYQFATLSHCVGDKEPFEQGYSLGTFLWDDVTGSLWFISLFDAYLNDAGWLEGDVHAIPVLTEGDILWGKFIVQRRDAAPFN